MLEADGFLKTYRLDLPPARLLGRPCTATKIQDHPLRFLTFEGSVNKGLGSVRIVDSGTYQLLEDGTKCRRLVFKGKTLVGEFRLTDVEGDKLKFEQRPGNTDA